MPPALESRPEDSLVTEFILGAFTFLSHFRPPGGLSGMAPIPFSDITDYATKLAGYRDPADILSFARLIVVCDTLYLKRAADKQQSGKKASKKPSKGGRRV